MKLIYWSLIFIGVSSCTRESQLAELPIFLEIPSVSLNSSTSQGSISHLITETWIYTDSILIGAYPVPTTVPIIPQNQQINLDVFAGIRENGQANAPIIYPFYSTFRITLSPSNGAEQKVIPEFSYLPNVRFALSEDFDANHIFREDLDQDAATSISQSNQGDLDGRAGTVQLTAGHPEMEVASAFPLEQLPTNGSAVFLELDYVSDVSLAVGLRGRSASVPPTSSYKIVLFESQERQKIYINFAPELQSSDFESYQILFRAFYDENLQQDTQYVFLDNIKLLHF